MLITLLGNIGMFGEAIPPVEPGDYIFSCNKEKVIAESSDTCETDVLIYNCTDEKVVYIKN